LFSCFFGIKAPFFILCRIVSNFAARRPTKRTIHCQWSFRRFTYGTAKPLEIVIVFPCGRMSLGGGIFSPCALARTRDRRASERRFCALLMEPLRKNLAAGHPL